MSVIGAFIIILRVYEENRFMNKQQLENYLYEYMLKNGFKLEQTYKGGYTKHNDMSRLAVEEMVRDMLVLFQQVFAVGGKIRLPELGIFEVRTRKPRMGRNPKTGEKVKISAIRRVVFKNSKELREIVNTK